MKFETLGLSEELLRALRDTGYTSPTPIQAQAIPAILKGSDIMAAAQTGTGKTAGFTLPILQLLSDKAKIRNNRVRALVLTPTRELAAQVQESVFTYGKYMNLRSAVVFGGVGINPQMMKLRKGVDVLVATPGRLLDLYNQNAVRFDNLEILVLDEADRMLDMGFIHDIKKIMALLPKKRQNLMFSATFSNEIRQLAKGIINNPIEVDVAPRNSTVEKISQTVYPVDKARKIELLSHLIKEGDWYQVLVFARTKHGSDKLVRKLSHNNINAAAIHGNKSQSQRTKALANFKQNKIQVLVATDIASRGIDIDQLSHVVNFDLPNVSEDYVHRIGRTGRAGASGHAISLVCADEIKQLQDIEKLIKFKIKREEIEGFEPQHNVPESIKTKSKSNNANKNKTNNKKSSWKGSKKKTRSNDSQSKNQNNNTPARRSRRSGSKAKSVV
ncbi:MAG: DEAD/DEAH box helicase [Proteobacteria bacterium]|nr:DEAD/DEAH box helicase [Pseudomonadota bacterium]NOG60024.1 DEAD/DEAH box helicase [Pseudomonadota bacterium]